MVSIELDGDLLDASRHGDASAFATLYRRHGRAVLRYSWARLQNGAAAEELLQDTFLTAWEKRDSARIVDESLLPWLLTICRNHAANALRRSRRRQTVALPAALSTSPPSDELAWLSVELDRLSALDREVVRLCLVEGYSYDEAARSLSTTPTAIGKRLSRARARLRSALGQDT